MRISFVIVTQSEIELKLSLIPNLISIFRIILVIPVVYYLLQHNYGMAFAIFLVACISDFVDGYVARRYDWTSQLGGWLDPVGDKILLNAVYLTLWYMGETIPGWLLLCVLGRDLMIVGGVLYYYYNIEKITPQPTLISKFNTVMQLVLILFILIHQSFPGFFAEAGFHIIQYTMFIVLGLTMASGGWYFIIGMRRMKRAVFLRAGG